MEQSKVDMFLMSNREFFTPGDLQLIKEKLIALPENKFMAVSSLEFKNPTTMLIISIFLGELGIDRFMLGETGIGVLKLLTGGVCGILWIIDWFSVQNKTKKRNFQKFMDVISM